MDSFNKLCDLAEKHEDANESTGIRDMAGMPENSPWNYDKNGFKERKGSEKIPEIIWAGQMGEWYMRDMDSGICPFMKLSVANKKERQLLAVIKDLAALDSYCHTTHDKHAEIIKQARELK